ncbi:MAG: superoxide dismutase [Fe] [Zetaproteobacteria bacterium CG12_big_fil_rev_8_21_14_0_65_54_13]|nr:MAG: superoxide dismutase [Fe] [Zetaproteobacteria bacterium CG23_combo_of_CG06-09_8_20_14_all_54_7]PIW47287.1 MAG: superoxide dismutase [Fe] [Zetaproteobacteria bacterium CG12_big_fil_rev_8_21_14_0_65_54_13]PIX54278.1 MAG: superoxide dismutase [Fe] [Zetaproteobacteria bacterium CG_4_10_14_3_um_filter_54_28]PJA30423.1 MAG: superoxide dismutase [Fe] [Zetaproteobacteria bacterium CG_4_9_14_3_um_filter_54_145]
MKFELSPLPYARDALAPLISQETLDYHYGKHHNSYVTNLNNLIVGTIFEESTLDEIIVKADGVLFNNAAQVWNHSFYWRCLSPDGGGEPAGELLAAIDAAFGSFDAFKQQFSASAAGNFGSGWTWLVKQKGDELAIINTANAGNPLTDELTPLLTCDVWEHAYYIDYRNARPAYIEAFWKLANWDFVATNFAA